MRLLTAALLSSVISVICASPAKRDLSLTPETTIRDLLERHINPASSSNSVHPLLTRSNTVLITRQDESIPNDPPCASFPRSVTVTFNEEVTTDEGETVLWGGLLMAAGDPSPEVAIPLTAGPSAGTWTLTLELPVGMTFMYRYVRVAADGTETWESEPYRTYAVPAVCPDTVNDSWR